MSVWSFRLVWGGCHWSLSITSRLLPSYTLYGGDLSRLTFSLAVLLQTLGIRLKHAPQFRLRGHTCIVEFLFCALFQARKCLRQMEVVLGSVVVAPIPNFREQGTASLSNCLSGSCLTPAATFVYFLDSLLLLPLLLVCYDLFLFWLSGASSWFSCFGRELPLECSLYVSMALHYRLQRQGDMRQFNRICLFSIVSAYVSDQ